MQNKIKDVNKLRIPILLLMILIGFGTISFYYIRTLYSVESNPVILPMRGSDKYKITQNHGKFFISGLKGQSLVSDKDSLIFSDGSIYRFRIYPRPRLILEGFELSFAKGKNSYLAGSIYKTINNSDRVLPDLIIPGLYSNHFSIRKLNGFYVTLLQEKATLSVNDQTLTSRMNSAVLNSGSLIKAGEVEFVVSVRDSCSLILKSRIPLLVRSLSAELENIIQGFDEPGLRSAVINYKAHAASQIAIEEGFIRYSGGRILIDRSRDNEYLLSWILTSKNNWKFIRRRFSPLDTSLFIIKDGIILRMHEDLFRTWSVPRTSFSGTIYDRKMGLLAYSDLLGQRHYADSAGCLFLLLGKQRIYNMGIESVLGPLLAAKPAAIANNNNLSFEEKVKKRLDYKYQRQVPGSITLTIALELQLMIDSIVTSRYSGMQLHIVLLNDRNEILAFSQTGQHLNYYSDYNTVIHEINKKESINSSKAALYFSTKLITIGSPLKPIIFGGAIQLYRNELFRMVNGRYYLTGSDENTYNGLFTSNTRFSSYYGNRFATITNFNNASYGSAPLDVSRILQSSINTASAYLSLRLGYERLMGIYDRFDLFQAKQLVPANIYDVLVEKQLYNQSTLLDPLIQPGGYQLNDAENIQRQIPSLILGDNNFSLLEVSAAFTSLYSGLYYEPSVIRSITIPGVGEILGNSRIRKVLDQENCNIMRSYLEGVATDGTARSVFGNFKYPVAVKTGTSNSRKKGLSNKSTICSFVVPGTGRLTLGVRVEFQQDSSHSALNLSRDIITKILERSN